MSGFYGIGVRRRVGDRVLDVTYIEYGVSADLVKPFLSSTDNLSFEAIAVEALPERLAVAFNARETGYSEKDIIAIALPNPDLAVASVEEGYFKLQLLSARLVKPHGICLDAVFGALENIAWSNKGPILVGDLDAERLKHAFTDSPLIVSHVDKFPYMVNYVVPSGIRIASGSQVRLGAYLGEGTTVMPAGYVNFNAGTEGKAMVEGRVSAGVFVGESSDVGGGASIMGTLSGGNNHVISVGANCLLGANSGTGISLGNGCTIAAGLYVYAGMKISLLDASGKPVDIDGNSVNSGQNRVKAMALSGKDYMLFIQDSQTGEVICKPNSKVIALNAQLHEN